MAHFEIEIKSLLGEKDQAEALKERMHALDTHCQKTNQSSQLNHYFSGNDVAQLYEVTKHLFADELRVRFEHIIEKGTDFSVRTRQKDQEVLLVVKASVDEGTSVNTVLRLEFEEPVAVTLDELDALVLSAGFSYQAKWSRDREEFDYKGATVCIDRNAGYGYLAEFEKITHDETELATVKSELEALMKELDVVELPQERLARMFAHYNDHWSEYYGTDKTFTIQ
jgi:adenylate cyclase class IV